MRPGAGPRVRRHGLIFVALLVAYFGAALFVRNSYYQLMLTLVPIWAAFGLSWNLFSGYSGLISFGHASFFGLGAYTVTLLLVRADVTPWLGIPAAAVVGGVAALLIGLPTFRLRGHYFALAMLAYPLVLLYLLQYLGFQEVTLPMKRDAPAMWLQFSDGRAYTAVALALLAGAMAVSMWVENSRFGLLLTAIRQNELAAEAAGIDARRWKTAALMLSGAMAGMTGGLYACVLLVVTPDTVFGVLTSAQALVVTMFGGIGTYWGPLIGAAILIPLSETLQAELGEVIPGIQGVVYGAAIIAIMLVAPEGLFWFLRDRRGRRDEAVSDAAAATPSMPGGGVLSRAAGGGAVREPVVPGSGAVTRAMPGGGAVREPPMREGRAVAPPMPGGGAVREQSMPGGGAVWEPPMPDGRAVAPAMPGGGAVREQSMPGAGAVSRGRPLLEVTGLGKSFGGLRAVDDVGFSVAAGRILGIIGPNGAGKTTLFNLVNGVLAADRGEALLDGQPLVGRKLHAVCRMGVGRTFQVVRSFPRLSLLDNVLAGAYGAGLADREAVRAAEAALSRTGLSHLAGRLAGGLTNKELRLMELARALAAQPRLLLLDETLAGLGREECDDLLSVLGQLRDEGMTIVIIEHTMHAMLRLADDFLVIDRGRVLARGTPRSVVEDPAVIEAYLGRKWLATCST